MNVMQERLAISMAGAIGMVIAILLKLPDWIIYPIAGITLILGVFIKEKEEKQNARKQDN